MDVSFSVRFQNVVAIGKCLIAQGHATNTARAEATTIESTIHEQAETREIYDTMINGILTQPEDHPQDEGFEHTQAAIVDEVFNEDGPSMGKYLHATFHAEGVSSTVYKARSLDPTGVVALKAMYPDQMIPPHNARQEVKILQLVQNRYIIPMLECFSQPGGRLVLAFPFLRQDLENLLRTDSLNARQAHMIFEALFDGLSFLHARGIIHRDIKPSNILLETVTGPAYIIDFGIAFCEPVMETEKLERKITDIGTTCYRPPEVLFGQCDYDTSVDIWAAGCIVAEMYTARHQPLFESGSLGSELGLIKSMFESLGTPNDQIWPTAAAKCPDWGKIKFKEFPPKPWKVLLPDAQDTAIDFVRQTVCFESTGRLTAEQALKHPLVNELKQNAGKRP